MTKKIIILLTISLLTIGCQSWADSEKNFTRDEVKQFMTNNTFNFIDKDTVSSLYALTALRSGENSPVLEFLEFQLDIIICEGWKVKDQLNEPSNKRAMELLRKIKEYRQQNPRKVEATLSQEQMKALFPGAINSGIDYTEQAKVILAELK
jgi:hypothetical protein